MDHVGWNDRPRSHWDTFFTSRADFDNYYINNILEKEVKPVLHHKNVNEATDMRKLFSSNRHMMFVQDGLPAHAAKAIQAWCKKTCQILQRKHAGPQIPQISTLWRIFGA